MRQILTVLICFTVFSCTPYIPQTAPPDPPATATTQSTSSPQPDPGIRCTVAFLGDLTLPDNAATLPSFSTLFGEIVEPLRTADIAVAALDTPVGPQAVPPGFTASLYGAGIDAVTAVSTEFYEKGEGATRHTLDTLALASVSAIGLARPEGQRPLLGGVRGLRVGLLAYADPESDACPANVSGPSPALYDDTTTRAELTALAVITDAQVVLIAWGEPEAERPSERQRAVGRALIDAGAEAVLGFHPRHDQGSERYKNGIVVYATGYPLHRPNWAYAESYSGLYRITLAKDRVVEVARVVLETRQDDMIPRPFKNDR